MPSGTSNDIKWKYIYGIGKWYEKKYVFKAGVILKNWVGWMS
jgi:hypothetical protein